MKISIKNKLHRSFLLLAVFCVTACRSVPTHKTNGKTPKEQNVPAQKKTEELSTTSATNNGACSECLNACHGILRQATQYELLLGIEQVEAYQKIFAGKRVGLITNATGINKAGKSSIDILNESVQLVALFSPEHGIRGNETAGKIVSHGIDKKTGLPVYSLYGAAKRPTKEMLNGIDILCFDIQDVGARFYTYIWTLCYAMEACAAYGKDFVVFDRPNPIGNTVEGAILQLPYRSFVGYLPIAQRHGMTVGELSRMFNTEFKIGCRLQVIPMQHYDAKKYFTEYPLLWIPTSPNIPHAETALVYSGICLFEGCNLSVGRGTAMPFEYLGAPYIDAEDFSDALNAVGLEGVFFYPAYFTPTTSIYAGQACQGIQIIVRDQKTIRPVQVAVYIFDTLKKMYPHSFKVNNATSQFAGINLLSGTPYFSEKNFDAAAVLEKMQADSEKFTEQRKPYLLY